MACSLRHVLASPPRTRTRRVIAPSAARQPPNQVLAIVCVGIVLANLDLFIVNVALPNIARDFHGATLEDLSWILNGYAIVYAALLVFFGRLAERYRRNKSFLLGVAMFTAASAACAAANGVEMLVAFRVVQAAGAALMTPTSLGLLLATFPPERRGGAVRTWTAIGGFAAALGPAGRRRAGDGELALDIPRQRADRPRSRCWSAGGSCRTCPATTSPRPDPWARGAGDRRHRRADLRHRQGERLGLGLARRRRQPRARGRAAGAVRRHCLRSRNPFVDPALFRIRPFTGAALVMAPFSAAFGAMLLSVALWGRRLGLVGAEDRPRHRARAVAGAGDVAAVRRAPDRAIWRGRRGRARHLSSLPAGWSWWALMTGLEPNMRLIVIGMVLTGIGVGLTLADPDGRRHVVAAAVVVRHRLRRDQHDPPERRWRSAWRCSSPSSAPCIRRSSGWRPTNADGGSWPASPCLASIPTAAVDPAEAGSGGRGRAGAGGVRRASQHPRL